MPEITIPSDLLPADGRFGSGPSKVPTARLEALALTGASLMGTSHRQEPVKQLVRRVREGLTAFFELPDGYEVALGNGGAIAFFDMVTYTLIRRHSQHAVFGEFAKKLAKAARHAPWLDEPTILMSPHGTRSRAVFASDVDTYVWAHNETSTGVMAPVLRPAGSTPDQLVVIDATSGAGGLPLDAAECDVYFFAPQKSFASDGGLWLTLLSPAAIERAAQIESSGRHVPAFFGLTEALAQSRLDQTVNTPAVATLYLLAEQLDWMLASGGLPAMVGRTTASSDHLYTWAEKSSYATPFVADPSDRSLVVGTIELDASLPVKDVSAVLRANGIVDVDAYRGVGTNQLRIAMYPNVDPADVEALTHCIDYVAERLA